MLFAFVFFAQFNPLPLPQEQIEARSKRAAREQIVARVGAESRPFVEAYGDVAVAALRACSVQVAKRLAEFHPEGLEKFPRPGSFLGILHEYEGGADDICLLAMQHADELHDIDAFNAFLAAPFDYVYGLHRLADGATMMRANRLARPIEHDEQVVIASTDNSKRDLAIAVACFTFAFVMLLWGWKKKQGQLQAGQEKGG